MNKDITDAFELYRESVRHLWNTFFLIRVQKAETFDQKWDLADQFQEANALLLKSLILTELDEACCEMRSYADLTHLLRVVPDSTREVPIMVNRPSSDGNKYWDEPLNRVMASDVILEFLECFDWDQIAYRDFAYYRVKIRSFHLHPNLVGREALIEARYVRLFIDK